MVASKPSRTSGVGPWQSRVVVAPGGGFAFRPGEVIVPASAADDAARLLAALEGDDVRAEPLLGEAFARFFVGDVEAAATALLRAGVPVQPNHVVFATGCCPPHPASSSGPGGGGGCGCGGAGANPFYANPFYANPFYANPFYANPFYANPFYANPFYANPFYANAGGCGCGCGSGCGCGGAGANPFYANPFYANPFYANPFYANPFYANPFYANADPNPLANPTTAATGRRSSSVRPADPAAKPCDPPAVNGIRIAILDTGYAVAGLAPPFKSHIEGPQPDDVPDEDGDAFLDPAAGHGTFIAGVIEQITPGCTMELVPVLTTYGDGDEVAIASELYRLATSDAPPDIVNLSFGGYSPIGMAVLAHAVRRLVTAGVVVVASAGNDATCVPMYPAHLPGVIGVAALDDQNRPAPFTNYGPWVRACTLGVDVVSTFFAGFDGAEPPDATGSDIDDFAGWARWSGTSFAAPRVAAALAAEMVGGATALQAVAKLIDDPSVPRLPMLGSIVLPVEP